MNRSADADSFDRTLPDRAGEIGRAALKSSTNEVRTSSNEVRWSDRILTGVCLVPESNASVSHRVLIRMIIESKRREP